MASKPSESTPAPTSSILPSSGGLPAAEATQLATLVASAVQNALPAALQQALQQQQQHQQQGWFLKIQLCINFYNSTYR